MNEFCPDWYVTEDFLGLEKINIFHKENERAVFSSALTNYHALTRAYIDYSGGKAILRITADDCYRLYVNGRLVCQGPAPSYHTHYYYNELDITGQLVNGRNVIAVHLYYQGLVNRVWQSGDNRFGIGADIITDDSRKELEFRYRRLNAFSGEIVGYDTDFTEIIDSRLWSSKWCDVDYDDGEWVPMIRTEHDYTFFKQPTEPVAFYTIEPKSIIRRDDGSYLVDIGSEICGTINLTAIGDEGSRVLIRYAEELDDNGNAGYRLRAGCKYEDALILNGDRSRFEGYNYKGFRYVEIIPDSAEIEEIKIICRHYPFDDAYCNPSFKNETVGRIFSLCKNTIKHAVQDGYIDCPTREKGQYLGDAFIAAQSHVLLTGRTEMLEKCIEDFAQTAAICKGLMAVSGCSLMQEIADYSLLFGELVLIAYKHNGDRCFLEKYYPVARDVILHFSRFERADGLLDKVSDKWNLVDWPENFRDNYDFELSRPVVADGAHNVINAYYIGAIGTLNKIEDLLSIGHSFDFDVHREAYLNAFMTDGGLLADCEGGSHCSLHSNVYALYFDIVPEENIGAVTDFIADKGLECGVYTSYFLLKGLCRHGRKKEALRLLTNEGPHGWINMLNEGATTCFEVWGREQKHNTSLCHPWATAPVSIILEDLKDYVISEDE